MNTNLMTASKQWAERPADQRFWTLEDAYATTREYADSAVTSTVTQEKLLVVAMGDEIEMATGHGVRKLSHWAFSQLAARANAPADYLRQLPTRIVAKCLNHGLGDRTGDLSILSHKINDEGDGLVRSVTSTRYERIWNCDLFKRLIDLQSDGWRVPPARPCGEHTPNARKATTWDCLRDQGHGLAVKPGDLIAPAGIYASDHDMFAFMVNENARIDDGSDGGLSRGFFISNSEVGAASLKLNLFRYRHVCGNHIVWGAEEVVDISIRHVGEAMGKFEAHISGNLTAYLEKSAREDEAVIKKAKRITLGKTPEEMLDKIFGTLTRRNLPSGMNMKMISLAMDMACEHESTDGNPYSVWGMVNGFTRMSQLSEFAAKRVFIDQFASKILTLAM